MLKINITDIELDSLLKSGHSKKYKKYTDKNSISQLSYIYTIMDSAADLEEIRKFLTIDIHEISPNSYSIHFYNKHGLHCLNFELQGNIIVLKNIMEL